MLRVRSCASFCIHHAQRASLLRSTTCDWASQAWDATTPETIRNCWKHSGKTINTSLNLRQVYINSVHFASM
ncbi:hypothetical protein JG688_00011027 [Phytophthora aleatoria]|uniref:Uncharacterized protein n=1 Tax=Phytophthora aleatoria TaxID=2496075 RepID=A0A8J5MEW3_9STRA|nr:hypothetical protein JG688_00011027 [Phytophthora aleatoria]